MEGKKIKHKHFKNVSHIFIVAVLIVMSLLAYYYRADISSFFSNDLTNIELINVVLRFMPKLIISIQILILTYVINLILKGLSNLKLGFTDKSKTVIYLVFNLLSWVVIIFAILWILSVWGVNTEALLTGAGILALVIGLGSQSIIADVLAGVFIVLEGKYVVGDIVVIDGWRGKIVSIGIRTTELQDISGNIKIVNNSEIKSVINQTKMKSLATCYINVTSALPFEFIEKTIKDELKQIRAKIPAITEDIDYKGVTKITDITIELLFTAKCYEEDLYQVQRDLSRELKLLMDKVGIPPFATPAIEVKNGQKMDLPK